jgi:hypothetical protein
VLAEIPQQSEIFPSSYIIVMGACHASAKKIKLPMNKPIVSVLTEPFLAVDLI